jgi:branched-chain amino acid aminotransferase/4-amino-4-deoxychorismate lyase
MTIAGDDRGLLLGDGLFETLLWSRGALVAARAHFNRLGLGCCELGLPTPDPDRFVGEAVDAVARAGLRETRAAVRITWTAGSGGRGLDRPSDPLPRMLASAAPAPPPVGPARLATASVRRNEGSPASRLKTLAYLDNVLARREARLAGADEALMLNNRGDIAGGAAANLFWFEGQTLVTPALECGVLAGITRAAVIENAHRLGLVVWEVAAPANSLSDATGLFLTNSLIGVRPVDRLDGHPAPDHPLVSALARALEPSRG